MGIQAIRNAYGVPAKRGMRVRYYGEPGEIHTGQIGGARGAYLRVRIETLYNGGLHTLHPTWMMEYLDEFGSVLWGDPDIERRPHGRPRAGAIVTRIKVN